MPGFMPGIPFVGGTPPDAASFRTPHRGDPESGNEKNWFSLDSGFALSPAPE
jgi:allophanate hydrolase subunit 1